MRLLIVLCFAIVACEPVFAGSGGVPIGSDSCAGPTTNGELDSRCLTFFGPEICQVSCNYGFGDCDLDASNGCEADLRNDPNNCGACGVVASSCGGDAFSSAETLADSGGYQQEGIAVDDSNVYWMTDGVLNAMPKGGGAPTVLARNESILDSGLALDDDYVYWPWATGEVHRVAKIGGPVEVVASGLGSIRSNIVAHGGIAYFVDGTGDLVDSTGNQITTTGSANLAISADGTTLFIGGARSIRVDGSNVTQLTSAVGLVAATSTAVFILPPTGSTDSCCSSNGPPPIDMAVTTVTSVLVGDAHVLGAPSQTSHTIKGLGWQFDDLAAFDATAYVVGQLGCVGWQSVVLALDTMNGAVRTIAHMPALFNAIFGRTHSVTRIAVDASYVYFVTYGDQNGHGSVSRAPR